MFLRIELTGRYTHHKQVICLFVCLSPHKHFFSYPVAVTITGDNPAYLDKSLALIAFK
jgi:hypothetical protein